MPLFDMYGNKIEKKTLINEEACKIIDYIRDNSFLYPNYGLNPIKLARLFKDADDGDVTAYLELAEEMEEKEAQYLSVLGTRKRAVSGLEVTVQPSGDSNEEIKHAEFVGEFISRDSLSDEIFNILDAVDKGFSVSEIIWESSENDWMPKRIEFINPKWFSFDKNGKNLLLKTEDGLKPLSP